MIRGVIGDDSFSQKNKEYVDKINKLEIELSNLNDYENDLEDFINFAIELMTNINKIIEVSDEITLPKFMSSIFEDKLEFEKEDYRTPKLNTSVEHMFQIINDLGSFKNKKGDTFLNVSRKVLKVGIEPTRPKSLDFESSASTSSAT